MPLVALVVSLYPAVRLSLAAQVPGCWADLGLEQPYFQRHKICSIHAHADEITIILEAGTYIAENTDLQQGITYR